MMGLYQLLEEAEEGVLLAADPVLLQLKEILPTILASADIPEAGVSVQLDFLALSVSHEIFVADVMHPHVADELEELSKPGEDGFRTDILHYLEVGIIRVPTCHIGIWICSFGPASIRVKFLYSSAPVVDPFTSTSLALYSPIIFCYKS